MIHADGQGHRRGATGSLHVSLHVATLCCLALALIPLTAGSTAGAPHDQIIVTVQGIVVEADFSYSKHGSTVQFTDRSSAICVAWLWYFGDSSDPVDEANPTHTYEKTGSFMVTLRVSDITGLIDEITKKVSIGSYDTKFFTAALGVIALVGGVLLTRGDERAQMASLVVIIVGIFIIVTLFMKEDLVSRVLGLGGF